MLPSAVQLIGQVAQADLASAAQLVASADQADLASAGLASSFVVVAVGSYFSVAI